MGANFAGRRDAWLLLALALPAHAALAQSAADCRRQPLAPARAHVVGDDMVVNGMPTRILAVQFGEPAEAVSEAWRRYWTRESVPARAQSVSGQYVLSAIEGECHYVLSLEPARTPDGRTAGLFSASRMATVAPRQSLAEIGVPLAAKVMSDVESRDRGLRGRTLVLRLPGRAQAARERYASDMRARGWTSLAQMPAPATDGSGRTEGHTLAMQRGQDRLDAAFVDRAGQTDAVLNLARPE